MLDPKKSIQNIQIFGDSPKEDARFFNFDSYVEVLSNITRNPDNKTPLTIAINGRWGSGKTSLMRTLRNNLEIPHDNTKSRKIRTIWFNAWKYSETNSLLAALIQEIYDEFGRKSVLTKQGLKENIQIRIVKYYKQIQIRQQIVSLIKIATPGIGLDVNNWIKDPEHEKYLSFYDYFQKFLTLILEIFFVDKLNEKYDDSKGVLVIFIDDLDRCSPKTITSILESVNLFFDQKGCIFIIGMDISFVSNAVDSHYKNLGIEGSLGKHFIKKMIQLQFNLPSLRSEDVKNFIENEIEIDQKIHPFISIITTGLENNPREVKQFLNSLNFLRMLGNVIKNLKIEEELLIKWCILDFISEDFIKEVKKDNDFLIDMQTIAREGEEFFRDTDLHEHHEEYQNKFGKGTDEAIAKARERYDRFKNNEKIFSVLDSGSLLFDLDNIPTYIYFSSISPKEPEYSNEFVSATSSASTIAQGDKFYIRGIATGNPTPGVAIWIFGNNYRTTRETVPINSDFTFEFEIRNWMTKKMDYGQYFVVVQQPTKNNSFEVDIIENSVRLTKVFQTDSPLLKELFPLSGPGSLQGIEAAETLIQAINHPQSTDIYTKLQFLIEKPVIQINPIDNKHVGEKITVSAETNLAVDDEIMFEVYQSAFRSLQKGQSGELFGASGIVKVTWGQSGMNKISFDVDTSSFKPDNYLISLNAILIPEVEGRTYFNLE